MDTGKPSSVPEPRIAKACGAEFRLADEVGERAAVRGQQRHAARDVERAERRDERRDVEPGDQQAIDRADQDADGQA